jgi:LPXTG-site transpeptidase (sortase) family protein
MQDIIPPRRDLRSAPRVAARPTVRTVYMRRTEMIDDIAPQQHLVVTETVRTSISSDPAPMTRGAESLSKSAKTAALQKALFEAQRALKKERRQRRDLKRFLIIFTASIFVLATGYLSVDTWLTNQQVKAELGSSEVVSSATATQAQEGKDETEPTVESLANYTVAASLPRALYIDKLDVAARVLPMGVNNDGSIQAPINIFDAGWYNGSIKPGEIGAAFIDGHASGPTRAGLFAYLDTLQVGDQLGVEKGDGSRLQYRVVHVETVALEDVDMKKALLPYGNTLRGLNLMTCTGEWLQDRNTYDQRVIVYTEQV